MSKNRLTKIEVGGKEYKVSKRTKKFTKKEREEAEIRVATVQAGVIYQAWKQEMITTPCKPQNLPGRVLAFRDSINSRTKNKYVKKILTSLADEAYKKCVAVAHSATVELPRHPNEGTKAADLVHDAYCSSLDVLASGDKKPCDCGAESKNR